MTRDHERCTACAFDGASFTDGELLGALRSLGPQWRRLLGEAASELRTRPAPETWSAIEYAAHSRDVIGLHAFGVEQALTRHEPTFPPFADDAAESAVAGYGDAEPDAVAEALGAAARRLATLAETAGVDAWERGLTVGDQRSDVRRLLEHALHDSQHHLDDVERGLTAIRSPGAP